MTEGFIIHLSRSFPLGKILEMDNGAKLKVIKPITEVDGRQCHENTYLLEPIGSRSLVLMNQALDRDFKIFA